MFVRVILIVTVLSFVYVQSIESREIQLPLTFDKQHTTGIDEDTESTKIMEKKLMQEYNSQEEKPGTTENTNTSAELPESTVSDHGSMHPGMIHSKKRIMNYKADRQIDSRPGCCG